MAPTCNIVGAVLSGDVGLWGLIGNFLLDRSISGFDPQRTSAKNISEAFPGNFQGPILSLHYYSAAIPIPGGWHEATRFHRGLSSTAGDAQHGAGARDKADEAAGDDPARWVGLHHDSKRIAAVCRVF